MADKDFKVKNGLEVGDHISLPDNKQIQLLSDYILDMLKLFQDY